MHELRIMTHGESGGVCARAVKFDEEGFVFSSSHSVPRQRRDRKVISPGRRKPRLFFSSSFSDENSAKSSRGESKTITLYDRSTHNGVETEVFPVMNKSGRSTFYFTKVNAGGTK